MRASGREVLDALDEELDRLPARYREPLVLCHLEGLTRDEAAARLGVSLATLKSQLDRGRKSLAGALTRRGVALGTGLLLGAITAPAGACPPHLLAAIGRTAAGSVSSAVGKLARVAATAPLERIKLAAVSVLGLAVVGLVLAGSGADLPSCASEPFRAALTAPHPDPKGGAPAVTKEPTDPSEPAKKSPTIEVRGVVLGPDHKPVPGAKLFLGHHWKSLGLAPQAAADAEGAFAFTVAEDEYTHVIATAPGLGIAWTDWDALRARPVPALTLHLTADEPIRGKVVNLEGKPIAGVSVSVIRLYRPEKEKTLDAWLKTAPDAKPGSPDLTPLYRWPNDSGRVAPATTDRDGTFEIRGVGRDRVAVLHVFGPTTAVHQWNVVTRKIEKFIGRGPINLGDDTFHGSEPILVGAPVPVTTGRVTDTETGKPIPGSVVTVEGLSQQQMTMTGLTVVADKDGRFTLPGVPVGTPLLAVGVEGPSGAPYHPVRLNVPDDTAARAAFDVKLTRGIPVIVRVVDKATGQPVEAQLRYGVFTDENPNVKRVPNLSGFFNGAPVPLEPRNRAEYRLLVMPGKGLVGATVYGKGLYLSGVGAEAFAKYRKGDELNGLAGGFRFPVFSANTLVPIDVPADAKEFRVTLELERGVTAPVRVVGADGKPVSGTVSRGLFNSMFANEDWSEPAPGATFTAVALRPGQTRRVLFLHTERKLAGSAVVLGGAKEPIEVRMEPWGEMSGRVIGAAGAPAAGPISMQWDAVSEDKADPSPVRPPRTQMAQLGADGRFRIDGLVPGLTYQLALQGPTFSCDSVAKKVAKSGKTVDLGDIVFSLEEP
ncbi:carboxypeptidase regulatory-like domain-containing protein [Frigoriglobus tundricola]|uniref:carboxypeptidase regulatory-like domain-containing protein n=1 Tax=Frigoriglobus tundricola TaxID=2774151 RepID=UPI001D081684|nr:carboxypeptidase regulatory-like domain-containing protein [Frigoriglobus tundricola]